MTARPAILFDLDGTLVDTAPDLIVALNVALKTAGVAPVDMGTLRVIVGQGARRMIERGLLIGGVAPAEDDLDRLVGVFLEHYRGNVAARSRPFPGAVEALEDLAAAGFRLGVCTNKFEALSVQLLDSLGLSHHFSAIAGADTFSMRKPDGRHLLNTLERMGGAGAPAVMVGDSETDVLAARSAGVPVIGVTFGYTEKPIESFEPDAVISHFDELAGAVDALVPRHARLT